jgi:hypothetical protein
MSIHAPTTNKIGDMKDNFYGELERVFAKFHKYHTKIFLGDFSAEVDREDIFKATIGNEILHGISNDNGVKVVNFPTSKYLALKKYNVPTTLTFLNLLGYLLMERLNDQIDHILVHKWRHSCVLDIRYFRASDCHTDHYLVVAKVRERLIVSKQTTHRVHMERFNLKKLNEVDSEERYRVKN